MTSARTHLRTAGLSCTFNPAAEVSEFYPNAPSFLDGVDMVVCEIEPTEECYDVAGCIEQAAQRVMRARVVVPAHRCDASRRCI